MYGDTLIDGKTWFVTDNGIQRSDSTKLYVFEDDSAKVELDFAVSVGDTIHFHGIPVAVRSVEVEEVLRDPQVVVGARSVISPDTTYSVTYASKFGIIGQRWTRGQYWEGRHIVAALLDGKEYGDTTFLHMTKDLHLLPNERLKLTEVSSGNSGQSGSVAKYDRQ